jgi:hypothetical protein
VLGQSNGALSANKRERVRWSIFTRREAQRQAAQELESIKSELREEHAVSEVGHLVGVRLVGGLAVVDRAG